MILPISPYAKVDLSALAARRIPARTYRLDLASKRIIGWCDNEDAMLQAVNKIFFTERFAYVIYTALYGIELESLIGKEMAFVKTVIGARIQDAVLTDDRVMGISDLDVKVLSKEELELYVIVHTIYGRIEYRKELMLS